VGIVPRTEYTPVLPVDGNVAKAAFLRGEQFVLVNPKDAAERGIKEGAFIRVFNDRGEFHGDARVTEDTLPGEVVVTLGYCRSKNRGGGAVNVISSDEFINLGHGPTLSDNLVQVELG